MNYLPVFIDAVPYVVYNGEIRRWNVVNKHNVVDYSIDNT